MVQSNSPNRKHERGRSHCARKEVGEGEGGAEGAGEEASPGTCIVIERASPLLPERGGYTDSRVRQVAAAIQSPGFGVAALQPSWRFAMLGPGPGRRGRGQARQEAEKERVKAGLLMPYSERGARRLF